MKKTVMTGLIFLSIISAANAGWMDTLGSVTQSLQQTTSNKSDKSNHSLSSDTISKGLKEALQIGSKEAIGVLGKKDGFYKNAQLKIPLPDKLNMIASTLRKAGMGKYVDAFDLSMNRAAEEAVPATASILGKTISNISIDDAKKILNGPDNAATLYFKEHAGKSLVKEIMPIIKKHMDSAQVTHYYKTMMQMYDQYGSPLVKSSKIGGYMNSFGFGGASTENGAGYEAKDLDGYVTNKALNALYTLMAQKEKSIRQQPAMQSSKLLQQVFGK